MFLCWICTSCENKSPSQTLKTVLSFSYGNLRYLRSCLHWQETVGSCSWTEGVVGGGSQFSSGWVSCGEVSLVALVSASRLSEQLRPPVGCSTSDSEPPSPKHSPPVMFSCSPSWRATTTPSTLTRSTQRPPPSRHPSSTASSSTAWFQPCSVRRCPAVAASSCTKRSASRRRSTSARRWWLKRKSARSRCRSPSSPWRAPSRTRWWWRGRWWWWCPRISSRRSERRRRRRVALRVPA